MTVGIATFIIGALAAALLTYPQWRVLRSGGRLSLAGLIVPLAVLPLSAAIYETVSTWREHPAIGQVPGGRAETLISGSAAPPVDTMAPATTASIRLSISTADAVDFSSAGPEASLFVFARSAEAGPPVAVLRSDLSLLPGTLLLSDEHAMLPGASLADFDELSVVARISLDGDATASAGDYYGEIPVSPSSGRTYRLVIDRPVE